jgi:hypothetical protein
MSATPALPRPRRDPRAGVELLADWRPTARLNLTASYAATHARFTAIPLAATASPTPSDSVLSAGASWKLGEASTLSLTYRRLGGAPLIEDNSVRSRPTSLVNALFVQDFGKASLMVEVLNLTNSRKDDIAYSTPRACRASPGGVDDVHFHPVEPAPCARASRSISDTYRRKWDDFCLWPCQGPCGVSVRVLRG